MKSNGILQKQYSKLTARERTAALVATLARGDTREADALSESAPRKAFDVVHHVNEIDAMVMVSFSYMVNQLTATLRFMLLLLWPDEKLGTARQRLALEKTDLEVINAVRLSAYRLCELWEGWAEFCRGLGIAPDDAVAMTGESIENETMIDFARAFCPDQEEAAEIWARRGEGDMPTRESHRISFQSAYDLIANRWAGRGKT